MAFAQLLAHPDVVEELTLRPHGVGFLALHGGLEPGTGELAVAAAASADASCYVVHQPHDLHRHVPSVAADPTAAPRLAAFLDHVRVVVSVHGYWSRREELGHAVLVGGARRDLVSLVAARVRMALPDVTVVDDPASIPLDLRGLDPRNPVNRASGGGVQLELPPRLRVIGRVSERPDAAPYRTQTRCLVETLAAVAAELES
ncbi:MAG: poly-gamma-glutamate hydrolase family protein [Acidimicrobiia bacterium]